MIPKVAVPTELPGFGRLRFSSESHTNAIQGLSEASQELKKGAAEQNKVLARLLETAEQTGPRPEIETEEVAPEVEEKKFPPGCIRNRPRYTRE